MGVVGWEQWDRSSGIGMAGSEAQTSRPLGSNQPMGHRLESSRRTLVPARDRPLGAREAERPRKSIDSDLRAV